MKTLITSIAIFGSVFAGSAGLAISMDRHYRQTHPNRSHQSAYRQLMERTVATTLLCISVICAVFTYGLGYGLVTWFGLVTGVCMMIALMLSYRPSLVIKTRWSMLAIAVIALSAMLIRTS